MSLHPSSDYIKTRSRKRRAIPLECPHCLKSFLSLSQHWRKSTYCSDLQDSYMHHSPSQSTPARPKCDTRSIGSNNIFVFDSNHSPRVSLVKEVVASRTRSHCSGLQHDSAAQRNVESRWLANYSFFSPKLN